jgi:CubicO group peptidase (beta-lactamase class C family)
VQLGEDQTIQLPANSVSLTGTANDPENAALTYAWTSSPADGVTFSAATALSTTVTFAGEGTYTLTLTANDGATTGSDALVVTVTPAATGGVEPVFPAADTDADTTHGWTFTDAAVLGMDDALLNQARDYALTGGGAGLIVRSGHVVKAWGDIDAPRYDVKSTTKSIGGIALALALDDKRIASVNDPAVTYLSNLGVSPLPNGPETNVDWLGDTTVLQLASHTAGFEKDRGFGAQLNAPGEIWRYSDGALNWLADLITQVYARDLEQLLVERVWNVLGVREGDDVEWRVPPTADERGQVTYPDQIVRRELASGITINAHTMARVGLLFLREGQWADTPVFAPSFIDLVRTPPPANASLPIDGAADFPNATTNYGVLWWTNATGVLPNVPRDAYWAWGLYDSMIVVIPSLDLVVVRAGPVQSTPSAGRVWNDSDWNGDYAVLAPFLDPIVQSVQQ